MVDPQSDLERIRDYAAGRLSEDERRMFEERLAREPVLVRELEQSVAFREGLQQLRSQGYLDQAAKAQARPRPWIPALIAAALAAVALLLALQWRTSPPGVLRAAPESASTPANPAALFTFVSLRGLSEPAFDLPAGGEVEFRVMPPVRVAAGYQVKLSRQDGGSSLELGTLSGLTLAGDGYVHFYADASALGSGRHTIRIEHAGDAASATHFSFELSVAHAP